MKTTNRKRWLAILMIFLTLSFTFYPVQKSRAQAQAGVVVGVLVIVAGGVVVYYMWHWCKVHIPPPVPPSTNNVLTNQLSGQWQIDHYTGQDASGATYGLIGEQWGSFNPYTYDGSGPYTPASSSTVAALMAKSQPLMAPLIGGYPIVMEFWLDNSDMPNIAIGTNTVPVGTCIFEQSTASQGISLGVFGNVFTWKPGTGSDCYDIYYGWDSSSTNMGANWSSGGIVWSNSDGDTVVIGSPRSHPRTLMVQSSTDLKKWTTITSTQTVDGNAFMLTDTNAPPQAFYRALRLP